MHLGDLKSPGIGVGLASKAWPDGISSVTNPQRRRKMVIDSNKPFPRI